MLGKGGERQFLSEQLQTLHHEAFHAVEQFALAPETASDRRSNWEATASKGRAQTKAGQGVGPRRSPDGLRDARKPQYNKYGKRVTRAPEPASAPVVESYGFTSVRTVAS
jgi:hypothetical protein